MVSRAPLLALLAASAGCVAELGSDAMPLAAGGPLQPVEHSFDGHIVVGAAAELPSHADPPERLVKPLWSTGVVLHVREAPEALTLRLDWTGLEGSELMLMAHAPHGTEGPEERGWSEYATPMSPARSVCIRIPPEDIAAGDWYLMVHSSASANVRFTITATVWGGDARMPDGPHGHDGLAPETVVKSAYTIVEPDRPWLAC